MTSVPTKDVITHDCTGPASDPGADGKAIEVCASGRGQFSHVLLVRAIGWEPHELDLGRVRNT